MKITNIYTLNAIKTSCTPKKQTFLGIGKHTKKQAPTKEEILHSIYIPPEIGIQKEKNKLEFQKFLRKKGKVTLEEYLEIKENSPAIILKAQDLIEQLKNTIVKPEVNAKAALAIKMLLDERYKNTGYRIISIGTSPASITETMQALGCEVIFVPISALNTYRNYTMHPKEEHSITKYPNISKVLKYLASKGIKKGKNDSKINVLIDYCSSGASLSILYDLIIEYNKIPKNLIKKSDILLLLYSAREYCLEKKTHIRLSENEIRDISENIMIQNIENIANVPHFHIDHKFTSELSGYISSKGKTNKTLFEKFESFSQPIARAFSLCSIHKALQYINKKNPDKNPD